MKTFFKILIVSIVFIGVTSIIFILFSKKSLTSKENAQQLQSPSTQSENSEWKVYKNTKYRFIFKYPSNWYIETDTEVEATNGYTARFFVNTPATGINSLGFTVTHADVHEDYVENAVFAGQKGYRHSEQDSTYNPAIESFEFRKEGEIYWFYLDWNDYDLELIRNTYKMNPDELLNKILNSIEFIPRYE